jgi:hypothetical protein
MKKTKLSQPVEPILTRPTDKASTEIQPPSDEAVDLINRELVFGAVTPALYENEDGGLGTRFVARHPVARFSHHRPAANDKTVVGEATRFHLTLAPD